MTDAQDVAGLVSKSRKLLAEAKEAKNARRAAEAALAEAHRTIDLLRADLRAIATGNLSAPCEPGRVWRPNRLKGA
ncbi:hypothetical protein T8K17_13330 [Thalassobaculum sp. OXR-137]|uniref:hypothetical protein n=1 Tax=Thalassobaculum sp. OXR-137 TaxID=3100173 RepID=UPI002AC98546|nr:hypothetical protein [Thalassobaculum sp. OXR-137]WPZ32224.1 hypothetical protein T8K17_13330 [Thalassobaculum sp. OXR-137]